MNYQEIYNNLINRALSRVNIVYVEKHHIVPQCLGGTDDESNLVDLTPEEHFVAHQLLAKIHPTNTRILNIEKMMTVVFAFGGLYYKLPNHRSQDE